MKEITFKEMAELVNGNGLQIKEDIFIIITNGEKQCIVDSIGCMAKPPFSTLYNKKEVLMAIEKLTKYFGI